MPDHMTTDMKRQLDDTAAKKELCKARRREHYIKNKDRCAPRRKEYYIENKERLKDHQREYYIENKERCAARRREHYIKNKGKNKDRENAYRKTYRAEHKCPHGIRKEFCVDCLGSQVCKHNKRKARCRDCDGSGFCKHGKFKQRCGDCNGSEICKNCKDWPDSRLGMKKYDGMCYRCYAHEYPDDPKVRTKERAEDTVKAYINAHFKDFVHDQRWPTAHCDCTLLRRVDHRRVIGNTLLCVETDEHHHRYYDEDDEEARYHDVLLGWGGKLCFIRFNPDDEGPPLEERLERLHAEMLRHIGRLERGENSAFLEVWHLYYPEGAEDYCGEAIAPEWL
jgi:hypothetical protein